LKHLRPIGQVETMKKPVQLDSRGPWADRGEAGWWMNDDRDFVLFCVFA
jgi:hypothetical protein